MAQGLPVVLTPEQLNIAPVRLYVIDIGGGLGTTSGNTPHAKRMCLKVSAGGEAPPVGVTPRM